MQTKKPLTAKQKRVLSYIKEHIGRKGYPPTVREIARHLQMAGPHSAKRFLDVLEEKGYIRRAAKSSRALEVIGFPSYSHLRAVPIVGRVRAGTPLLAEENIEGSIFLDPVLARWDDVFFLRVEGESMVEAHIQDGDLALVKPQPALTNGDIAVVLIRDEATIKQFFKDDRAIRLVPANPAMETIVIRSGEEEVIPVGRVVALLRTIDGIKTSFKP